MENLVKESKTEFNFSESKGIKLSNLLSEAGFVFIGRTFGYNLYISHPQKWHPKIGNHYLPVAFMRRFSLKLVNLDEEYFGSYHRNIKAIYDSIVA